MVKRLTESVTIALMLVGCAGAHALERAENAAVAAAHKAAVEKCVDEAVSKLGKEDRSDISAEYKSCADAADRQYGRKD